MLLSRTSLPASSLAVAPADRLCRSSLSVSTRHLLPVFEHTLLGVPLSPPLWLLSARPDAARWNPLHAPWLSTPALARLLVDLADVVVPFAPAARSLAISYLTTFITAFRLLPDPWFTFDDLYGVLESGPAGPALIDRAVASVWGQYTYEFDVDTPGYSSVPEILREVVITPRDVAASRSGLAPRRLSCVPGQLSFRPPRLVLRHLRLEACRAGFVYDHGRLLGLFLVVLAALRESRRPSFLRRRSPPSAAVPGFCQRGLGAELGAPHRGLPALRSLRGPFRGASAPLAP